MEDGGDAMAVEVAEGGRLMDRYTGRLLRPPGVCLNQISDRRPPSRGLKEQYWGGGACRSYLKNSESLYHAGY